MQPQHEHLLLFAKQGPGGKGSLLVLARSAALSLNRLDLLWASQPTNCGDTQTAGERKSCFLSAV